MGAIALGMLVSGEAFSNGECGRVALPAGLKTLCPNTPALASDLNDNFRQLARWMSDRLGALADSNIVSANVSAAHISSSGRLSAGGNPGDPVVVDVRACSGSDCCPPGYSSSLRFSGVILCRLYAD